MYLTNCSLRSDSSIFCTHVAMAVNAKDMVPDLGTVKVPVGFNSQASLCSILYHGTKMATTIIFCLIDFILMS